MRDSTNEPPEQKLDDPETALGGADAVEKTTYVVGDGTSPEARAPREVPPDVGHTWPDLIVWIVIGIAVLVGLVYAVGVAFRR
ncbi:MAG TPA: hypothetical protein VGT98_01710 [Candidatus Elarobacter sp.]|nr:hypothetical protein [Candidatus Elarobacter sp.]